MKESVFSVLLFTLYIGCNAQNRQHLEFHKAFASVYGYVKYFHPSDEAASIDWDKFAIYGAYQIQKCTSEEQVLKTLKTLFEPIAPSIRIKLAKENTTFELQKIIPTDLENYKLTYWQHKGVSLGMRNRGRPYSSVRINREYEIDNSSSFGNIITSLDATPYKGKKFKYTGWVKLENESKGTGHLWFRVDKSDSSKGFFNNMQNSPIIGREWQQYEIVGDIDSMANKLVFGCFLQGKGKLFLDDVKLAYKEGENWVDIPLENGDFESQELTFDSQWRYSGSGYTFDTSEIEKYEGNKSATILFEGEVTSKKGIPLFKHHPIFGELIKKKISQNISCEIPITLYCNDDSTFPKSDKERLESLKKEIKNTAIIPTELPFRLGNIINVYNVFQHFYPYFNEINIDWDNELENALLRCYADKNNKDHLITLQKFTASLNDGHIRVSSKNMETFVPPIEWEWVEDKLAITAVYNQNIGLEIGDIVSKIDGQSATKYFQEIYSRISAGTDGWLNYRAQSESLFGPQDSQMTIETNKGTLVLKRDEDYFQSNRQGSIKKLIHKELKKDVFYINLDMVEMDLIKKLLPKMKGYRSIIFDLRGYPKGNHGIISHLLKSKDTTQGWMQVPQIIYPDQKKIAGWEKYEWMMETATPYIGDKQIIFITDGRAISYAESIMGYIEGYRLATIVGQPTAGTNGNINPFRLPGGFNLSWTGMKVTKHDGSQHHTVGIIPDIYVTKTIEGLKADKDEFLEKAIELTEK